VDYRFNPAKGVRRRGHAYGEMDNIEFDSEEYDSKKDWWLAIGEYMMEIEEADQEQEVEGDDEN
jgi:hypothetical protein